MVAEGVKSNLLSCGKESLMTMAPARHAVQSGADLVVGRTDIRFRNESPDVVLLIHKLYHGVPFGP